MILKLKEFTEEEIKGLPSTPYYDNVGIYYKEAEGVWVNREVFKNIEDYNSKVCDILTETTYIPFTQPEGNIGHPFDICIINLFDKQGKLIESVLAYKCHIYIMNDNGKTIDSTECG